MVTDTEKLNQPLGPVDLTAPLEKPDPQKLVRSNIHNQVYNATQDAVHHEIDQGKNDVRNGVIRKPDGEVDKDAPWYTQLWAWIKSLIFAIAEAFGFEKGLAKMFGSPIPETNEVKSLSNQVAVSASTALTDDKFTYANKTEFESGIEQRIAQDLQKNRSAYPSFTDDKLKEVAKRAAHSIGQQQEFSSMFDGNGKKIGENTYASPVQTAATVKFSGAFESAMKGDSKLQENLAQLSGKANFGKDEVMEISRALAPTLMSLDANALKAKGDGAFTDVATQFRTSLISKKEMLNRTGAKWNDETLNVLADRLAVEYMKSEAGVKETPKTFADGMKKKESAIVEKVAQPQLFTQVDGAIRETVAKGVMEKGYAEDLKKFYLRDEATKTYSLKTDLTPDQLKEVGRLQDVAYSFAQTDGFIVGSYKAPELEQRYAISSIVSQTAIEVLKEQKSEKKLTRDELASVMEIRIRDALKAKESDIDKKATQKGHTIDAINKKMKMDVFGDVAREFANTIRTDDKSWGKVDSVRTAFTTSAMETAVTAANDPNHKPKDKEPSPGGHTPTSVPAPPPLPESVHL